MVRTTCNHNNSSLLYANIPFQLATITEALDRGWLPLHRHALGNLKFFAADSKTRLLRQLTNQQKSNPISSAQRDRSNPRCDPEVAKPAILMHHGR